MQDKLKSNNIKLIYVNGGGVNHKIITFVAQKKNIY